LNSLPISSVDIEQLSGLPEGFLEDEPLIIQLTKDAGDQLENKDISEITLLTENKKESRK
ncbi:MAG: hypothetical protein HGA27_00950, partial [Peptococcaceae bacterium]|nr:hypothetical protein [Peptococcaceae bacterium]